MELSIKETTCRRDSGEDPATCDFRKGYLAVRVLGNTTLPEINVGKGLIFFRVPELIPSHMKSLAAAWHPATLGGNDCVHTVSPGRGCCDSVGEDLSSGVCGLE